MLCPRCKNPLIIVERNSIELDYCLSCRGIWFDSEELGLLNQALGLNGPVSAMVDLSPIQSSEETRKCPRCSKTMEKVCPKDDCRDAINRVSTLTIDRCPHGHGLWFDAGELGQLFRSENQTGTSRVVEFLGGVFSKT